MFAKLKGARILSASHSSDSVLKKNKGLPFSILGSDSYFNGKIVLKNEARLAGHVDGIVISEDVLIVEESAFIKGEIRGVMVEVSGSFEGKIVVSDILRLTSSARVEGEISALKLIVDEGAKLRGHVCTAATIEEQLPDETLSSRDVNLEVKTLQN